jgi:hypothetical protein
MIAFGMTDENVPCHPRHISLCGMLDSCAMLALDPHIEHEYYENMRADCEARRWLAKLAAHDRIQFFEDVPQVTTKTARELKRIKFGKKDHRFIRLALATEQKILVAEEPHFFNVAPLLRRNEEIEVLPADGACDAIQAMNNACSASTAAGAACANPSGSPNV